MANWLDKAVFYEIYPQSFMDGNGDGVGDFAGIVGKLDYLEALGVNAIWMNPCFDSSFFDAGYDVRDYYSAAPRYGSNEELRQLFRAVHDRGMHILLDLVPGHTAVDHPWFRESCKDERNAMTDRYIWRSGGPWGPSYAGTAAFLCGLAERPGAFAVNCFASQPALNYGFATVTEPWQFSADSPEAEQTRKAMEDVMAFWLDLGCDGFRVDMAGSLVKEDPDKRATIRLWQKVRAMLDARYPEAALVSEWGNPAQALEAGFHMDFLLHTGPTHYMDLFRTAPYFSASGSGDLTEFVKYYSEAYAQTRGKGLICIPSGNHDMVRMRETLTKQEMKLAFVFLLTMPGCPFVYYGDEIGMRYLHGLKSKEGGYQRTGSRTPMQWERGVNAGFSAAAPECLYLPVDPDPERPNVEAQRTDPNSLWNHVSALLRFRREHPALDSGALFRFLTDGKGCPLVYERSGGGERLLVALNPSAEAVSFSHPSLSPAPPLRAGGGAESKDQTLSLPAGSWAICRV
ncbi:MAG: DUF3459 domain-containing protein [Oscillospiraceae bacterium]|nr:DUF3459 domain-containing protein [Oscillospiraceae bacterium]